MQFTITVPDDKVGIVRALAEEARRSGRTEGELVLEALESYLRQDIPQLGLFHMGVFEYPSRDEIYHDFGIDKN